MRTTVDLDAELLERALAAAGPGATKTAVIEEGLRLVREKFDHAQLEKKRTRLAMKALADAERKNHWVSEKDMDAFFDSWEGDPTDSSS